MAKRINDAEVRIDEEEVNSMPARAAMLKALEEGIGQIGYKAVDLDSDSDPYWQNESMTLVIAVDSTAPYRFGEKAAMSFALGLADFVHRTQPDEYHVKHIAGQTIIRFWWD